jgi:hypothetical protein
MASTRLLNAFVERSRLRLVAGGEELNLNTSYFMHTHGIKMSNHLHLNKPTSHANPGHAHTFATHTTRQVEAPGVSATDKLLIVGGPSLLGAWQPAQAVEMERLSPSSFYASVYVPADLRSLEYKYVVKSESARMTTFR